MILLISSDLMVISTVDNAAISKAVKTQAAASSEGISGKKLDTISLVIVDLESAREDIGTIVSNLRTPMPSAKIVAFGPHVKVHALELAAEAGCDLVLARGQFFGQLNSILEMGRAE